MLLHLKGSHIAMNLEKEQLPTPMFWPGEFPVTIGSQRVGHD